MKLYFKEHEEYLKGYHLVVMFVGFHRCGYIGFPKGHALEDVDYSRLYNLDVHGGLTYSGKSTKFKDETHDWYLGFDCGHFDDGADIETMKAHGADITDLMMGQYFKGEIRTKEYVMEELKNLVKQIDIEDPRTLIEDNECSEEE